MGAIAMVTLPMLNVIFGFGFGLLFCVAVFEDVLNCLPNTEFKPWDGFEVRVLTFRNSLSTTTK